jgi:hypothetical protein
MSKYDLCLSMLIALSADFAGNKTYDEIREKANSELKKVIQDMVDWSLGKE